MLRTIVTDKNIAAVFDTNEWDAFAKRVDTRKTVSNAHAKAISAGRKESIVALTPQIFAHDLEESYVWLDYFSIPQKRAEGQADAATTGVGGLHSSGTTDGISPQIRAIRSSTSIPHYIERATYFVVVVHPPPTTTLGPDAT